MIQIFLVLVQIFSFLLQRPGRIERPREMPARHVLAIENYSSGARLLAPDTLTLIKKPGIFGASVTESAADPPLISHGCTVEVGGRYARIRGITSDQIVIVTPESLVLAGERVEVVLRTPLGEWRDTAPAGWVSPGLFRAQPDALWSAGWYRVGIDLPQFLGSAVVPFATADKPVVFLLYGSGWRYGSAIRVRLGDSVITPSTWGEMGSFAGFDTVSFALPASFRARGIVFCRIEVDGVWSNTVWVQFPS